MASTELLVLSRPTRSNARLICVGDLLFGLLVMQQQLMRSVGLHCYLMG